ncbi:hypothetical protein QO058_04455 [Bosea vestrisii]|uniref:hypothetical protein n=1 Tax=Bosea vestrisii TaxID=151416 RepID=UPI0024DFB1B7|nr:hypothetical protein [Bosea vestrisii]WID97524.1 hypothetical protein QO058_04455 [Bosea vestrisii]
MTTSSNSIDFAQYIAIPLVGASFVHREEKRRAWLPFFHIDTHHEDDTCGDDGIEIKGYGAIRGYSLHVGRWLIAVDRPTEDGLETRNAPLTWNQNAWLVLAAPAVTLAGFSACLLGGLFTHFFGKLSGPSRPDLLPEL